MEQGNKCVIFNGTS